MNITIDTTEKDVIIKHLEEALENREHTMVHLQKLESGFYHMELVRNEVELPIEKTTT